MARQQEEKITFPPGTVVLQAINDNEHCVAVVVGDHMVDRLNPRGRELFEIHRESGDYHILLVLSHFKTYDDRWSTFAQEGAYQFPTYILETKRTATKADLSKEIALLLRHKNEAPSRGLCSGRLHAYMFGFSMKQHEALELVALVEHYFKGGNVENLPKWIFQFSSVKQKVLNELTIACPL